MGYKVKRILVGDKQVRPYRYNPGSNTIAYFPFSDDLLDHSGNGVTLQNTGYLSKDTIGYKWVQPTLSSDTTTDLRFQDTNVKFISIWYKVLQASTGNSTIINLGKYGGTGYKPSNYNSSENNKIVIYTNSSFAVGASSPGMSFNVWHHLTVGYDGSKVLISKDGVQSTLYNGSGYQFSLNVDACSSSGFSDFKCIISEYICEKTCWTAEQIATYYNGTKSNYGL